MWEFLTGLVVGGAVGILGYYLGHMHARRVYDDLTAKLRLDKAKLEADLSIAQSRVQDLIYKL